MKNIGIYVHIPFCKQKCKYCDFVSFANKENMVEEYFNCLLMEIEEKSKDYKTELVNGKNVKIGVNTIYIGGGTPSFADEKFIEQVLNKIKECFKVLKTAEITIEVNPGTVTEEKLRKYYEIGINRISIGLQSTNDNLLKMLGRIHNYKEFEDTYNLARSVGFKNINVDLMIGLPKQTIEDVQGALRSVIEKNPEHISVYSLIVEENTKMFDLIESGKLVLPTEELEREMYWLVKNTLEEAGYKHYEISNFAKPKKESKHNMNCWKQESYLGIGCAAHSYFNETRFSNISNLKQYIKNIKEDASVHNIVFHENQNKEQMMKEYMLLGLRKIDGVNITEFKNKFSENAVYVFRNELNKLVNEGLIEIDENDVKLTDKGIDLANQVWMEFV
jgi:oxygen-independent coproporphyrinogen-3 oxidase